MEPPPLAHAYINTIHSSRLGDLVVSLSNGSLCHLKPESAGGLGVMNEWHAHDYEPWIAAWNHHDTNIIYSGKKVLNWKPRITIDQPNVQGEMISK